MTEQPFGVVRARRFELVDAANRPWAALGFNEEGEVHFNMLNRDGRGEIILSFHEDEPEMWIFSEGNARMHLAVTHGDIVFSLSDEMDSERLKLRVDKGGEAHILVRKEGEMTEILTNS